MFPERIRVIQKHLGSSFGISGCLPFINQFSEDYQEAGKGRAVQPFSRIFLLSSDILEQIGRRKLRVLLKREPFSVCDLPPHGVVRGSATSAWIVNPLGIQTLDHSLRTFIMILCSGLCPQLPAYEPFPEGSRENEFLFSEAAHRNSQSSLTFFLGSGLKER